MMPIDREPVMSEEDYIKMEIKSAIQQREEPKLTPQELEKITVEAKRQHKRYMSVIHRIGREE